MIHFMVYFINRKDRRHFIINYINDYKLNIIYNYYNTLYITY